MAACISDEDFGAGRNINCNRSIETPTVKFEFEHDECTMGNA